jgi:5-oxopent-3-ene-1,2,5-tricarboxylate decarboxylase/2-hydroxyhepta-2,4-diene-1,7-dioate isomerase
MAFPIAALPCPVPPYRLSGTVLVALLNHSGWLQALGDAVHAAPYKAPPQAPVLGVKPRNTWAGDGAAVAVPPEGVVLGASLGLVIGRSACGVPADQALGHVAGYLVAVDLQLPMPGAAAHYRPAIRQRARDGFCPLGPAVVPAAQVAEPDALALQVWVDGALAHAGSTAGHIRAAAQLVADVSAFMTLQPGDVLLLGSGPDMPLAHAGQQVVVDIASVGRLGFGLVPDAGGRAAAGGPA